MKKLTTLAALAVMAVGGVTPASAQKTLYARGGEWTAWSESDLVSTEWHNTNSGAEISIVDGNLQVYHNSWYAVQKAIIPNFNDSKIIVDAVWKVEPSIWDHEPCFAIGDVVFGYRGASNSQSHAWYISINNAEESNLTWGAIYSADYTIHVEIDQNANSDNVTYSITDGTTSCNGTGTTGMTAGNTFNLELHVWNNSSAVTSTLKSVKVTETAKAGTAETLTAPTLAITGKDNGCRIVTITSGESNTHDVTTAYTIDGGSSWTAYTEPFKVANATVKARTTSGSGSSADSGELQVTCNAYGCTLDLTTGVTFTSDDSHQGYVNASGQTGSTSFNFLGMVVDGYESFMALQKDGWTFTEGTGIVSTNYWMRGAIYNLQVGDEVTIYGDKIYNDPVPKWEGYNFTGTASFNEQTFSANAVTAANTNACFYTNKSTWNNPTDITLKKVYLETTSPRAITLYDKKYRPFTTNNANITVNRSFIAGFNTICLPFSLTQEQIESQFGTDTRVYTLTGETDNGNDSYTLNFTEGTMLAANTPAIIKVATAKENPTFSGVTIAEAATPTTSTTHFDFLGVYEAGTVPTGDWFVRATDGKLVKATSNNGINAFRAYIAPKESGASARALNISFGDEATGIETIVNSQLLNDNYYDLQGRRVALPTKGLYIVNGKKFIIK